MSPPTTGGRTMARAGLLALCVLALGASSAWAALPTQYVGKVWSEALGRAIDYPTYSAERTYLDTNGCNLTTLRRVAKDAFTSAEYTALGYDNQTKVLTLYRALLNRDPDPAGLTAWTGSLNSGTSISTVIDNMTASAEFTTLTTSICSATTPNYGWGTFAAVALTPTGAGFTGTGAALQTLLNGTPPGGTVALAQKSLVNLTTTLTIPAGVTLTTTGGPGPNQYGMMGRLARNFGGTNAPTVILQGGARLRNVWVDGQKTFHRNFDLYNPNLQVQGGSGTEASSNRIDNTQGWTSIAIGGSESQVGNIGLFPCARATVSGNLVTAYGSSHDAGVTSDGISSACENTTITNNSVIDMSDVGIIIFESDLVTQRSLVQGNTVVQYGQSAYAAYAADPLRPSEVRGTPSFVGSSVTGNTLWTTERTHFHIGLSVGTRPWFGTTGNDGTGASFTNNSVPTGARVWAPNGIVVSGMLNVTVTGNNVDTSLVRGLDSCTVASIGVEVTGHWSGTVQGPTTAGNFSSCIFPRDPRNP